MRLLGGALLLTVTLAGALRAQSVPISLLVIDDSTDTPLRDVRVSVFGEPTDGLTDADGRYVYVARQSGSVLFFLRRLGYQMGTLKVDISGADTVRATFAMKVAAQTLAGVKVRDTLTSTSPALREFERRASIHAGSATYLTRSEIERQKPSRTTDLLRRVSSISVIDSSGVLMAISRRIQKPVIRAGGAGRFEDLANCPLEVAVDGQLKEWGYAVNSIPPEEIHGIEVYPGPATIPAEYASFRRDAHCGLILLWTRRDK